MADRAPDWDYWRQIPEAKIWEMVALSLNIEPRKVQKEWDTSGDHDSLIFPDEGEEFRERLEIAIRSLGNGLTAKLAADPVQSMATLAGFPLWATSRPREWPESSPGGDAQELTGKARKTLLQLVLGMAAAHYRYNPDAGQNSAPRAIADTLHKMGVSETITPQTVRTWLETAVAELHWKRPSA